MDELHFHRNRAELKCIYIYIYIKPRRGKAAFHFLPSPQPTNHGDKNCNQQPTCCYQSTYKMNVYWKKIYEMREKKMCMTNPWH